MKKILMSRCFGLRTIRDHLIGRSVILPEVDRFHIVMSRDEAIPADFQRNLQRRRFQLRSKISSSAFVFARKRRRIPSERSCSHLVLLPLLEPTNSTRMILARDRAVFTACRSGNGDLVMNLLGTGLPLSIQDDVSEFVLHPVVVN
jgi:hypothetical protein